MPSNKYPSTAYLAFDLGASSSRAILGRLEGDRLQMEELHRFSTPIIEEGEQLYWDLDVLWSEFQTGLQRALNATPRLYSLSVNSIGLDYVPLNVDRNPIRNAYSYRSPRKLAMRAKALQKVSASELYEATGIHFMEENTLPQVLADLEQESELLAETANRLMMADYFNYRFSGRAVAEVSLASTTGLLDVQSRTWARELMARFGIPADSWPEIVPSGTRLGSVTTNPDVTVIAGCSHNTACAVAAVPASPKSEPWAYLSCGTWSVFGVERTTPFLTEVARQQEFTNEVGLDGSVRLLRNMTGLWVLQECEREWKNSGERYDYETLLREAGAAPDRGVSIDFNESRFRLRGNMQQKIQDYCREQKMFVPQHRGELVRGILSSLASTYQKTLSALEEVIEERIEVLHIVGGGARNALLCQLTANTCGCQVVAGPVEATAMRNLLIQARTMGHLPNGVSIREVVRNSSNLKVYQPLDSKLRD
ncbi:MAG: rhamnulokinase [Hormoscilla sp. SP12CHS1]|nr:rhamnulokinase [Hormoscilla sp. SP12CHS1]